MRNNQGNGEDLNASLGGNRRAVNSKTLKAAGTKSLNKEEDEDDL